MNIAEKIIVLFILILIGFIARKFKLVSSNITKEISGFVINLALPSFIFTSMNYSFSEEILRDTGTLLITAFSFYFISIILSSILLKVMKTKIEDRDVFQYVLVFPNVGFMGYPVLQVIFGDIGVFYGAVYNLSFSILVWTYGVYIMNRHGEDKRTFKEKLKTAINPGLIAVVLGYTLFVTSISLPTPIFNAIKMVGSTSSPLSMMVIGFILTDVKLGELFGNWRIYFTSVIRLIALPTLFIIILKGFGLSGLLFGVPVVIMGMPAAVNTAIIAARYGNNYKLASKLVFVTTLISIITIPIIINYIV